MTTDNLAQGTIVERDGKFYLLFSNGREEGPFGSKAAAEKRERQVQFFKHRSEASEESKDDEETMDELGIAAEYRIDGSDEAIYFVVDGEDITPYLVKASGGEIEVSTLSKDYIEEYAAVLDYILDSAEAGDTYRNRYWSGNPGGHNKGKFRKLKKKCAKCGKTGGMLDIHHKSGSRSDLKSGKNLQVLCRSCHRKLHQGGGNSSGSFDLNEFDKVEFTIGGEDINVIGMTEVDEKALDEALASNGMERQKDLMYVRFVLAHEGTNKNRDHFTREALKAAASTPVLKAINWEHGEPVIGLIYKSEYSEVEDPSYASAAQDGKRGRIICEGAIWKYRYPAYAKAMIDRYMRKDLKFSMETYFGKCSCTECGEEFSSKNHSEGTYCDHLNYRKNNPQSKAARVLQENVFSGTGVVANPADEKAGALAIAKNQEREEGSSVADENTKTYTEADVKKAVQEAIDAAKAEFESGKELQTLKARVSELETDLASANERVSSVEKERDDAKAEVVSIKETIVKAKAIAGRMRQLSDAGYAIPEAEADLEKFRETIAGLSDEGFELLVTSVKAQPETDPAEASVKVPASGSFATAGKTEKKGNLDTLNELLAAFLNDPTAG